MPIPTAMTIAGSDSGGGAGIQADLKAFSAMGVYGASAITALTAQNTVAVTAVTETPLSMIKAQIDAVLDDIRIDAIKIGMLSSADIIKTVADALKDYTGPIVLDPVMIAKSGDALLQDSAIDALKSLLLPRATLLTPNLPEAARLLDQDMAHGSDTMIEQGKTLAGFGASAVLMKGGHGSDDICTDLLISEAGEIARIESPRIQTGNSHGTGCSLSSAIAANLAKGLTLPAALERAHTWLHEALKQADDLGIGNGHGPVHHFHALWSTN